MRESVRRTIGTSHVARSAKRPGFRAHPKVPRPSSPQVPRLWSRSAAQQPHDQVPFLRDNGKAALFEAINTQQVVSANCDAAILNRSPIEAVRLAQRPQRDGYKQPQPIDLAAQSRRMPSVPETSWRYLFHVQVRFPKASACSLTVPPLTNQPGCAIRRCVATKCGRGMQPIPSICRVHCPPRR